MSAPGRRLRPRARTSSSTRRRSRSSSSSGPAIGEIAACFYSHWHPDHTMGRRVWETRNGDFRTWPIEAKRPLVTDVYLPEQVASDFREWLGGMAHLEFMAARGWIRIHELRDGETVEIGDVTSVRSGSRRTTSTRSSSPQGDRRLLVAMDELNGWTPPPEVRGCDLAVLPMGICEFDLFTGERLIHEEHPCCATRRRSRRRSRSSTRSTPRRVVLSHVEEMDSSPTTICCSWRRSSAPRAGRHVRVGRHRRRRVSPWHEGGANALDGRSVSDTEALPPEASCVVRHEIGTKGLDRPPVSDTAPAS